MPLSAYLGLMLLTALFSLIKLSLCASPCIGCTLLPSMSHTRLQTITTLVRVTLQENEHASVTITTVLRVQLIIFHLPNVSLDDE